MKLRFLKICICLGLTFAVFRPAWASSDEIFVDPSDRTVVRRAVIPFVSEIVLRISDLPERSAQHPNIAFEGLHFTEISVSPDGNFLAWIVHGLQHGWVGLYSLRDQSIRELTFRFESEAFNPIWSPDSRFLAVEELDANDRREVEIFNLVDSRQCSISGKLLKNKFANAMDPWWNKQGSKIYFKVDTNNEYRQALGLKPLKKIGRIGEAQTNCEGVTIRSVAKFIAEEPSNPPPEEILASIPLEGTHSQ